jgi:HAD superfamily phosphoserine phosphatase-like hydrolase
MRRFETVVLDVDSTLSSIEGIDWLAERRTPDVAAAIARLTERAMDGATPLEQVYGERLALVRPTAAEIAALGEAYVRAVSPGADDAIARLHGAGVLVLLVSGGVREAIAPLARRLGVPNAKLHAVSVRFHEGGAYAGWDERSPLATADGKRALVETLALPRPALAVGDGATDLAMRPAVDAFAAFTGVVRREPIVCAADHVLDSFDALAALVLG